MENVERIELLSGEQISEIYGRPEFNADEQILYFDLTERERNALANYTNIKTQLYFILQLGYFKAKQNLFKFGFEDVASDYNFILKTHFKEHGLKFSGSLSRQLLERQKLDVLHVFNYKGWTVEQESNIEVRIGEFLRHHTTKQNTLRQLLDYLNDQKIIIPPYRKLQDMFTKAFSVETNRLSKLMLTLPDSKQKQLSSLVDSENGISQLSIIRIDQKNFQYTAVKIEVEKAEIITDLYDFAKLFIPKLKISKNSIHYYADLIEQYTPARLRKLNKTQQLLQMICFIYHRYQQIMDNLIISFIYHTKIIMDASKAYAEIARIEHASKMAADLQKLSEFLDWFPNRKSDLTHDEVNEEAYKILPKEQFKTLSNLFGKNTFDKKASKWEYYSKSSRVLSLYLRPILLAVSFKHYKKNSKILELINLIKTHYSGGKNPSEFKLHDDFGFTIPTNMIKYLKREPTDENIDPYLFEFYVYEKICHQVNRGLLFCNESISYCDIEQDLIDEAVVNNVEKISDEFGYSKIPVYCDRRLDDLLLDLNSSWETTTENIKLNLNAGFNIKESKTGKQDWSLLYDTSEKLDDAFFKTLPKVAITDMMMYIGDLTDMWSGFTHMKDRYIKRKNPAELAISACVLSEAFGFGAIKMGEMSDINVNLLESTRENFIRVDTLCDVNDIVSNFICSLPIFKLWNLLDDKLLADSDGQKMPTTESTIQSRYSKKYLGKGKGISIYTLIANFVAVNAKNIGLNEYEGHSLYDMIYGNKTDIEIDMVTGDNHSLNKLNFVALDAINVEYVPSIKSIKEAANDLYSAQPPEDYSGFLIPKDKININKIKSQKRGILRILLSLILQENTQTNIIRKLNSHDRYARLKAGLLEYNKIFKSIHVLNLIDDMQFRKALRTARNRTEAYHQLQGLIRKIYNGIFKGKRIVDNRISAHASRLVANCIMAYNSVILNKVYMSMLDSGVPLKVIEEFARISPIAWVHILFTGKYNFRKNDGTIDVEAMAKVLEKHLKQNFWKAAS